MGKEKTTETRVVEEKSSQTREMSPEQKEFEKLQLGQAKAVDPFLRQTQESGLKLVNQLLKGDENLPGFFNDLQAGISPEVTQGIVRESLRDISPGFQQSGILDSGVAAEISARTAGDIRRASEEFNIGNRLNLLNLALSGQAQVQSPILSQSANLGARLSQFGTTNMTGSSTGNFTTKAMNPFVKSFQTSLGSSFGETIGGGFGSAGGGGGGGGGNSGGLLTMFMGV